MSAIANKYRYERNRHILRGKEIMKSIIITYFIYELVSTPVHSRSVLTHSRISDDLLSYHTTRFLLEARGLNLI